MSATGEFCGPTDIAPGLSCVFPIGAKESFVAGFGDAVTSGASTSISSVEVTCCFFSSVTIGSVAGTAATGADVAGPAATCGAVAC